MDRVAALLASARSFVGDPQFMVIAATAIFVAAGVLWGRRWYLARTNGHAGGIVADAFVVIAPYLAGLVILGLALFAVGGSPRPWYETAAAPVQVALPPRPSSTPRRARRFAWSPWPPVSTTWFGPCACGPRLGHD